MVKEIGLHDALVDLRCRNRALALTAEVRVAIVKLEAHVELLPYISRHIVQSSQSITES